MSAVYGKGAQAILEGSVAWLTDSIRCVLINTSLYAVSIDADQFLSDVPAGARMAISAPLASKASALGVATSGTAVFSAVSASLGVVARALAVYKDTGVAGTSRLLAYVDQAPQFPVTPNGGDIDVTWSSFIFKAKP